MLFRENKTRRLAVLLIAPDVPDRSDVAILGHANPILSDSESIDYAELLSGYNYRFDIIKPEEIHGHLSCDTDSIKYSSIVLTVPLSTLTDSALSLIRKVSHDAGVSLIAAYDHPDERSAACFGIERFKGKKILWPLKAKITQWPLETVRTACVADYGLKSGFSGIRRRGLRKLSWKQTLTKGLSLIGSLILPYMKTNPASGVKVLSTTMRGEPLAWSYRFGNATNYYFALHSDMFLDKYNEMHFLVRSAIEANSGYGIVSLDLDKTMALRLDDPGASKADYEDDGELLNESEWNELGKILSEKKIPLSVMYTPGWVDDGDARSGSLLIDDRLITQRTVGAIYDSPRVKYVSSSQNKSEHDHLSEFRGVETLVRQNLVDVHSHGLTHLVPDYGAWAAAKDKNSDSRWYTEFFHTRNNERVKEEVQMQAMVTSKDKIEKFFGTAPSAITPSGHRHDSECDIIAHGAGYKLFSSDYTGILRDEILIRNWKIPSIFLFFKEPSSSIAKAGYPVIAVVHDYEIKGKLDSLCDFIDKWSKAGIRRFISLSDLTASLCSSIEACYSEQGSSMNIDIVLPGTAKSNGLANRNHKAEILVRVISPQGSSCEEESIGIEGGSVVSFERSAQDTINLLISVGETNKVKITIPLSCERPLQCIRKDGPQVVQECKSA